MAGTQLAVRVLAPAYATELTANGNKMSFVPLFGGDHSGANHGDCLKTDRKTKKGSKKGGVLCPSGTYLTKPHLAPGDKKKYEPRT